MRVAVGDIKAQYEGEGHQLEETINNALEKRPRLRKNYKQSDPTSDRLYRSRIIYPQKDNSSCATVCSSNALHLVSRSQRTEDEDNPAIHCSLIASANQLMKDALFRDKLAAEKDVL